jgi:hypothetical protein
VQAVLLSMLCKDINKPPEIILTEWFMEIEVEI